MKRGRMVLMAVGSVVIAALLIGCGGPSSLRIGWIGQDGLRSKSARYQLFSGVKRGSFDAKAGEMIVLEYAVEVQEGTLALSLNDPDGEALWSATFEERRTDEVRVEATQDGRYGVVIEGESTRGSFEVAWCVGER